jgi:flagellar biosynthesis/type III secretory pathway chaperone
MSVAGLIQTMYQLIQIHQVLLELSQQKTSILVMNQVEQLNQIVNKETSLIKKIKELDNQRIIDINEFLLEKGYKPNPRITVEDVTKLVFKADDKRALEDAQRNLLRIIEELQELNQLNQKLIEQSLAFIEYSMDIVLGPPDDEVIYHKPLQQQNVKRNGIFDQKA